MNQSPLKYLFKLSIFHHWQNKSRLIPIQVKYQEQKAAL